MAGGSGSVIWTAAGGNLYTVTTPYTVTWTPGSTLRSSSPPSGSDWGGATYSCGTFATFTINCEEVLSGGLVNEFTFNITGTAPACPTYPPSWSDNTLSGFQVGVAYSDGVSATNSPTYSVSAGSLPAGISLNTGSGAVTGTPTTAGAFSFTLQAANVDGAITQAFSGTVAAAPTAGKLKVYNGSSWVYGPVKVYNGTAWVDGSVKVWNGTAWVTSV